MTQHSEYRDRHLGSRHWRFFLFLSIVLLGIAVVFLTPIKTYFSEAGLETLLVALRETWWTPFLVIGVLAAATILGIPTTPLLLGGAAFGIWWGSIYNSIGLILGAALSFELARVLGREFVISVTGDKIRGIEQKLKRFAFWPLVQLCFTPIPFPLMNYGAALCGVSRGLFLSAVSIGLIPSTVLHTYFMVALMESASWNERGILLLVYFGVFILFNIFTAYPWISEQFQRRANYKKLTTSRAQRNQQ